MMPYKKLVSILIPTRKRVKLLKECLDSLNIKTQDKSLVEILLKIDTDDQETIDFVSQYKPTSDIEIKELITDRKNGYGGFNYMPKFWQPVIPTFQEYWNLNSNSSLLDVGCAKGFMLYDLSLLIPNIKEASFTV